MRLSRLANSTSVAIVLVSLATALALASCSPSVASPQTQDNVASTQAPSGAGVTATVDPSSVSFARDVLPIFQQRCSQCHSDAKASGRLSLSSYEAIMKGGVSGSTIVAGEPDSSVLVQFIVDGKMPMRGEHLPQSEIDLISAWVKSGAPNN